MNEQLDIKLNSEYCETIGGYISERLGHIPTEEESIQEQGYSFTVLKMDDKWVAKIRIQKTKVEENEDE